MFKVFSRRQSEAKKPANKSDLYTYNIESNVRNRIFYTLRDSLEKAGYPDLFERVLPEVEKSIFKQYGHIDESPGLAQANIPSAAVMHFLSCSHEKLIDFLEFFFRAAPGFQGTYCVEPLNAILREERIGYEFTPLITRDAGPGNMFGRSGGRKIEYDYPQAIRKSDEYGHQAIVRPCLDALADPVFATAHGEMLAAHDAYRQGNHAAAITSCGSAFESVLKTICDRKSIAYDPKDTCSALVQKCQAGGLFPSYYAEAFKAVGTLRNNLSTAHGRGPKRAPAVSQEQADHMIQTTSAHITFLVKLAR
jgi:Abortive infection C-terminus